MSFLTAAHLMSKYGPLLTEDQLAEVLHCEPGTIRTQRSVGNLRGLPVVRHGKKPLFHAEDVANLIEEMREAGRLNR
jgi:3-deoxy-D-arabino-heptulosonate 7-phosphate (DAHP) synthase